MNLLWEHGARWRPGFPFLHSHFSHHHLLGNSSFPLLICGDTFVVYQFPLCKWIYVRDLFYSIDQFVSSCAMITLFFVCFVFALVGLIFFSFVIGIMPYAFYFRYLLNPLRNLKGLYYYLCFTQKEIEAQKM